MTAIITKTTIITEILFHKEGIILEIKVAGRTILAIKNLQRKKW